jgi:hypothetical protein
MRIRVPKSKLRYVFWFVGTEGLAPVENRRGRDNQCYYSPTDYSVSGERQWRTGTFAELQGDFG